MARLCRIRWWMCAVVVAVLASAAAPPLAQATVSGTPEAGSIFLFTGPRPFDVELDPSTALWHLPNVDAGGVAVLDAVGRMVNNYGAGIFTTAAHVAVSGSRSYVTTFGDRVEYFSTDTGAHLGGWGGSGTATGQFDAPWGIDVVGAEVFVADSGNDRVQVFDLAGTHLRTIDGAGTARPMAEISGIAVDEGLLYVAESGTDEVVVYSAGSGAFVRAFATGLSYVADIELTTANDVFVSGDDGPSSEVAVFDVLGNEQTRFAHANDPEGFAVDPGGESLWFADSLVFGGELRPAMSIYTYASCRGALPTFVGTSYPDTLDVSGWSFDVTIWLGAGADSAILGPGDDVACGGDGADTISGLDGNDILHGGPGQDLLRGGPGDDELYGEGATDLIQGGGGNDSISGGPGADLLFGQGGPDIVNGDGGDDTIHGQGAADTLFGGDGDDDLNGQNGADNISGQDGNDVIRSHTGPDVIEGGAGDDQMFAGNGADELYGGAGTDKCAGNLGPDRAQAATCEQTPGVETLF